MKICGLQKTTLLDYPGHVAATVFLGGCNFRCPFCHNKELLGNDAEALFSLEELLGFFKKRASILEGGCITGGEPTLFPEELEDLIRRLRSYGYPVSYTHLVSSQISGILHNHNGVVVPLLTAADGTKLLVRQREAFFTIPHILSGLHHGAGQTFHLLRRHIDYVKCQPLCGLGANAGEF